MAITATIQDGQVVCDSPVALPNGTVVTLVPLPALPSEPGRTLAERLPSLVNSTEELEYPEDSSSQIDHYLYGTPKR